MADPRSVVLAAGGTAGHVFPALALYRELRAGGADVHLLTDERGQPYCSGFEAEDVSILPSGGLVSGSITKRASNAAKLASGLAKSVQRFRSRRPHLVIGLGGYASVGPLLAAQFLKIPNVLHEQNSVMGAANRLTAKRADVVALSFDPTEGSRGRCVVTGNPSRSAVVSVGDAPWKSPLDGETVGVLIMGGSQGARSISETVPAALASLPSGLRSRLRVTHQARAEDHDQVTAVYGQAAVEAEVVPFVDVPDVLQRVHLVIGRSGATTVCDVAVARRPAVYLPLLTHADLQQVKNAQAVADVGGAILHREDQASVEDLASNISELLRDPDRLGDMADAARAWSHPDAASRIVSLISSSN